ncbi:MAG: CinA family protein [Gammaproteobacteria bacterium]|jgi:PncC family amidohydrolase|nr:CinA family protein [Gammaproteobacteria bacterium]HJP35747.1 CinA family protein [Gammaproteobacteria bacterium]
MTTISTIAADLAATLVERRETIAVAESSTGGLISASLLAVPGASAYFLGGTVVYTIEARRTLLNIPDDRLKGMTPLSEDYVSCCAAAMRQSLDATWGLAELGATGPAGTRYGHPPGICVLALDGPVKLTKRLETGSADREANMWTFVEAGLDLLREALATNS